MVAGNWRDACRECGDKPAPGRAWCMRCLSRVLKGYPTCSRNIPTPDECAASQAAGHLPWLFTRDRK